MEPVLAAEASELADHLRQALGDYPNVDLRLGTEFKSLRQTGEGVTLSLIAGGAALERAIDDVLANYAPGRLIFNLGHGIQPETPIAHVEQMVKRVRDFR